MKTKIIIQLLISSVLMIIINQALSINKILREALEPLMVGPFLGPIKSVTILCFFIAEIMAIYVFLDRLTIFEGIFS